MGTLVFEGRQIYWETHGEGPPLLFLHEWNSSSALFREHALDRYTAEHEVILVDLPGFGRSEALDVLSMEGLSRLLVALLDTLGHRRTSVLGFCLGAILGLDFALRHPRRVDRLVLVDILVRFPVLLRVLFVPGVGAAVVHFSTQTAIGTRLAARFLDDRSGGRTLARSFRQVRIAVSLEYLAMMRRYAKTDHLRRAQGLESPVLCLASGSGPLPFRRCAVALTRSLPEGHLSMVPASRHYTFLTASGRVSPTALAFFRSL